MPDFPLINKSFNLVLFRQGLDSRSCIQILLRQILRTGIKTEAPPHRRTRRCAHRPQRLLRRKSCEDFGRALAIRHVDAGSCNGCELEIHALNNRLLQHRRAGHQIRRQPAPCRHAAGDRARCRATWRVALKRTYDAMPEPKLVVAVGDCGCNGGIFGESYASCGRVSNVIPVDVAVPGCPPTPTALMQGILTAISSGGTAPKTARPTLAARLRRSQRIVAALVIGVLLLPGSSAAEKTRTEYQSRIIGDFALLFVWLIGLVSAFGLLQGWGRIGLEFFVGVLIALTLLWGGAPRRGVAGVAIGGCCRWSLCSAILRWQRPRRLECDSAARRCRGIAVSPLSDINARRSQDNKLDHMQKKYASFSGRMLMVGFGAVGRGLAAADPAPHRHAARSRSRSSRANEFGKGDRGRVRRPVPRRTPDARTITPRILARELGRGIFLVNASFDVSSVALIEVVPAAGRALYRRMHRALARRPYRQLGARQPPLELRLSRSRAGAARQNFPADRPAY